MQYFLEFIIPAPASDTGYDRIPYGNAVSRAVARKFVARPPKKVHAMIQNHQMIAARDEQGRIEFFGLDLDDVWVLVTNEGVPTLGRFNYIAGRARLAGAVYTQTNMGSELTNIYKDVDRQRLVLFLCDVLKISYEKSEEDIGGYAEDIWALRNYALNNFKGELMLKNSLGVYDIRNPENEYDALLKAMHHAILATQRPNLAPYAVTRLGTLIPQAQSATLFKQYFSLCDILVDSFVKDFNL